MIRSFAFGIAASMLLSSPAVGQTTEPAARAPGAIPDLKGTWSGKGKAIVLGSNPHHSGPPSDTPRVRDIEATHIVEGQDGQLAWGRSSSTAADTKEPFVWAITSDNKAILGADQDGYYRITLISTDRMEKCYVHSGTSPSRSIVASCYIMNRSNR